MLIVCNEILAFPHCFLFPFSCVYPTIWGDPARTGMVKTHRFSNPGHCRDCQTKEVFTFQIAGKQLEHFRFFSNRSNGLQDFIPHTYTTIWERITVIKKIKSIVLVLKRMPEDIRIQKPILKIHFVIGYMQKQVSV